MSILARDGCRSLRAITTRQHWFNLSARRVGGLFFIKIGRITLMFCLSKEYRPL